MDYFKLTHVTHGLCRIMWDKLNYGEIILKSNWITPNRNWTTLCYNWITSVLLPITSGLEMDYNWIDTDYKIITSY